MKIVLFGIGFVVLAAIIALGVVRLLSLLFREDKPQAKITERNKKE